MDVSLVLLGVLWIPVSLGLEMSPSTNLTNSTNDMYVIHATVYQVGIITNKSDDEIANMTLVPLFSKLLLDNVNHEELRELLQYTRGNQEALSFYRSNGSAVDFSAIPAPLMTNVTAESAVAVAPVPGLAATSSGTGAPAAVFDPFTSGGKNPTVKRSENLLVPLNEEYAEEHGDKGRGVYLSLTRRSAGNSSNGPTIKVVKETSLIPPEVGLKSIGLPDLLGLNTSVASVPLPIPNTSVVRYAKISTLVKAP